MQSMLAVLHHTGKTPGKDQASAGGCVNPKGKLPDQQRIWPTYQEAIKGVPEGEAEEHCKTNSDHRRPPPPPRCCQETTRSPSAGPLAHHSVPGNEKADEYAKATEEGAGTDSAIVGERETSLSHMARLATEARSRSTAQWITAHVGPQRGYGPPRGEGIRREGPSAERESRSLADITSSYPGTP